jgi:ABC-2 type transport system permease protein
MTPPNYLRILWAFARNSLIREMTFKGNFLIEIVTTAFWFSAQIIMFDLIFRNVGEVNGWTRYEYFAFMATGMIVNTLIEAFFMPNCANFSELIRTGNLDFVLLKPIDTQFLVSFEKLDLGALANLFMAGGLLGYALWNLGRPIALTQAVTYVVLIAVAVTFFYALMITLASTSIWFGRNQGLYDFWFYITIFARHPRSIYVNSRLPGAEALLFTFTFLVPILLVVTLPAETVTGKLFNPEHPHWFVWVAPIAALVGLFLSRRVFQWSLKGYRSASS